jgi:hypothetical protein
MQNYNSKIKYLVKFAKLDTLVLLTALVSIAGCTDVQPWERGNLAKPIMAADPLPLQSAVRQHNYASREAAGAASSGASGGGCGCN